LIVLLLHRIMCRYCGRLECFVRILLWRQQQHNRQVPAWAIRMQRYFSTWCRTVV